MDEVYGMHNIPGIKVGEFAVCPGPIMAARDNFEVFVKAGDRMRLCRIRE